MQDLVVDGYVLKIMKTAREEEPWPGYYFLRGMEYTNLMRYAAINPSGLVLDLGCGTGFISCLLSSKVSRVVGTDLYSFDQKTHSPGIDTARRVFSKLKCGNVTLVSSSAEQIPFKDEMFDMVYAGYVFQYLRDKQAALKEIRRVLKKDGVAILVLPNFLERIYSFFQFYIYLAIKSVRYLWDRIFLKYRAAEDYENKISARIDKFKNDYSRFPFPGPHGAYRNSAVELIQHMPMRWNSIFKANGFRIKRSFTTTFVSYPLFLTFSVKIASIVSKISDAAVKVFGDKPVMKYLGDNYCVVLKK